LHELLSSIYKCGWCGHQYTKQEAKKLKYCDKCRGGLDLKPEFYNLLVLRPLKPNKNKIGKLPQIIIDDILEQ